MKNKFKKTITLILFASLLILSLPHSARADAWGSNMMAAIQKQLMEEVYLKIKETVIANLKIAAIRTIQGRLQTLLGGVPGGIGTSGLVISDWRQFIYGSANRYSTAVTSDYFKHVRNGIPRPLQQRVIDSAQKTVMTDSTKVKPDLQNFVREGRADMIFTPGWAQNPWMAWRVAALPQNNPAFYIATGLGIQGESFRQKEEEKKTEGQAGLGVEGVKKSGPYTAASSTGGKYTVPGTAVQTKKIVTPGSVIKDLMVEVQSMPIRMVTLSRSIPEIVASMVTQMLTQMIYQGIAKITEPIDKQLMNFRNTAGLPMGQIQNYIQSGVKTYPSQIQR